MLTAAVYAPTRGHRFVYEDVNWQRAVAERPVLAMRPSRALAWMTHHLTWRVVGDAPMAYHLGNVGLHVTNGVLVYAVTAALIPGSAAVWGAGVFLLHPLNSEAVNYLSARTDLLMTSGVLLAVWGSLGVLTAWRALVVCLGLLMAMTSKEIGLIGVPLVALTLVRWRRSAPQTVWAVSALGIGCGALLGHQWPTLVSWFDMAPAVGGAALSWGDFLTLQTGALWHLFALVLPSPLWLSGFSIDHDVLALTQTALAASALLTLVSVALIAWGWPRLPLVTWALAWAGLSVAPRFVFRTSEFVTEPQLYLSMVGLSVLLGVGAHALWMWTPISLTERTA